MGRADSESLVTAALATRRHYLTVLFADLSDSTMLGNLMEAEVYGELLAKLRGVYRDVLPRHGGIVVRIQGDGLLAIFGYPDAREDDGRRATEAALELHAAVRELRIDGRPTERAALGLHSGIHGGLVLLAEGDLELGRFELLGPVPSLASRLSDLADFDEILVSEETLGPQAHFFETGERRVLTLKGRPQPMPAYRVLARAPADTRRFEARASRGLAPFVGREVEMAVLERHRAAVAAGEPRFVSIEASPGMGKTRLVEEFLRHVARAGHEIHRGYCEHYLGAEPLQPFLQMLRGLFGLAHDTSPGEAAALAHTALARLDPVLVDHRDALLHALSMAPPGAEARHAPEATLAALRDLFDRLASKRPVVVFVDDWQWADDASQHVLAAIRALPRPILVLLASRERAASDAPGGLAEQAERIPLAPLNPEDTGRTIRRLLPKLAPFQAARIHRYAGGNPLFIEEMCHSMAADGTAPGPGREHGAAWLHALIESRVARLPSQLASIVRAAAVIGNVFPGWLLERITGHGPRDVAMRALAEQDFIFPADGQPGALRFKHGITRDVVYGSVGLRERQAIHLRVADALIAEHGDGRGQEDVVEALAYHYGAGGRFDLAAQHAEAAGDKAMAASAIDRARKQFRAALQALDTLGADRPEVRQRWISVAQRLGMVCVFDPLGLEDGITTFERAEALARASGDLETIARAKYWLGYICYAKGRAVESIAHCEEALELAERIGDPRLAAQVRATLGQALATAARYDRALGLLDGAIQAKRRHGKAGGAVPVGSVYSLACKAGLLGDRGDFADAYACFDEALELLGGGIHQVGSSVRGWLSTVLQWQGRWAEALQAADEAVHIAEVVKSSHMYALHRAMRGHADWMLSDDPAGIGVLRDSTAWIEARHGLLFTSLNYGWLVDSLVTLGQPGEARRHAARGLWRARQQDRLGEAMVYRGLASAAAQAGEFGHADRCLALAMRSADLRGSAHERASTQLRHAEIEIARDRLASAERLLDEASPAFERMRMHWHLARAAALRSAL